MLVTVGMPVLNGAATLDAALWAVRRQTHRELEIIVSDNASTDATPAILARHAAEDARITVIRQPERLGPHQNFQAALTAARGVFFLWRADDDLSDLDYVERLAALLAAHAGAELAVGRTRREREGAATPMADVLWPETLPTARIERIAALLELSHATWIYGLWRREALVAIRERMWRRFPHVWAGDHAALLSPALDDAIVGDNATAFVQRIGLPRGGFNYQARPTPEQLVALRGAARPVFVATLRAEIADRGFAPDERALLEAKIEALATLRVAATKLDILRWRVRAGAARAARALGLRR